MGLLARVSRALGVGGARGVGVPLRGSGVRPRPRCEGCFAVRNPLLPLQRAVTLRKSEKRLLAGLAQALQ